MIDIDLKDGESINKIKENNQKFIVTITDAESCLSLIIFMNLYMMVSIPQIDLQENH